MSDERIPEGDFSSAVSTLHAGNGRNIPQSSLGHRSRGLSSGLFRAEIITDRFAVRRAPLWSGKKWLGR